MFLHIVVLFPFCNFKQKVQELEKEIMESREKNEFYRTKMQELVSKIYSAGHCTCLVVNRIISDHFCYNYF